MNRHRKGPSLTRGALCALLLSPLSRGRDLSCTLYFLLNYDLCDPLRMLDTFFLIVAVYLKEHLVSVEAVSQLGGESGMS